VAPEMGAFFMDLIVKTEEKLPAEEVSLEPEIKDPPKEFKVPKARLAENIRKYDEKIKKNKVYTQNPYDYNSISLQENKVDDPPTKQASEMLTDKTYNTIGKLFGIDTVHDWNKYYDKIYKITEWAKDVTGTVDTESLVSWIADKTKTLPNLGAKNIDNLFIFAGIYFNKK
jgi:hypothetical protein